MTDALKRLADEGVAVWLDDLPRSASPPATSPS